MTKQGAPSAVAAVDLGATSGRVIVGRLEQGVLHMRHIARFANDPVHTIDGMHWNLLELYRQVRLGLAAAERDGPGEIASVGIDSWAVDYGLLRGGRLLGAPYHYRDARNETGVAAVHVRVNAEELFARNGLQYMPFNTLFQLAAERATEGEVLSVADRLLLIPDLLNYWLTGSEFAERTNASTTGLLDARSREWDLDLADRLGIPAKILPPLIDAGATVGTVTSEVARQIGRALKVVAVGSHDTASAVVAIPSTGPHFAYISCGTWGLVGLELDAPILSEDARRANFTNEGGVDGRTRFLRNVMGLWLLSESLRHWEPAATDAQRSSLLRELLDEAARVSADVPVFDVNDPVFLPAGDIPERIRSWYRVHGDWVPGSRAEVVRCIIESLAEAFAVAVRQASRLADLGVTVIHLVGGGSMNTLLCQATANRSHLRVVAGPTEATAIGSILIQARAIGQLPPDLHSVREVVKRSFQLTEYLPR